MKTLLILSVLFAPVSTLASEICAPHAGLLELVWSLSYERIDGPSRIAKLDRSECRGVSAHSGVLDFDQAPVAPSAPEPQLRYWSEGSPYELHVRIFNDRAELVLVKRDGRYQREMARIDRFGLGELASTSIDYTGDVEDEEYPQLRAGRGVRKLTRAARVVLVPGAR